MSELRQVDVKQLRALEDERDVLAAERAALLEQVVYWRECVQDMVAKAAANNLEGYRELGQRVAKAEAERDALSEQLGKSERLAEREGAGFRALCEAFERLEQVVGLDTGGGMGPGPALNAVEQIVRERDALAAKLSRYSMCAGHADQRLAESRVVREALGFGADADDVSPRDLLDAIARIKAEWQAEALDNALEKLVPRMLTKADAQIVRDTIRSIKTPGSRRAEESAE